MKKNIFITLLLLCCANFSCIQEDEESENVDQSIMLPPDIYYKNLYTALTQAFETLYKEITIEDTYLSISKKIDKAAKQNSIINGCDMNKASVCIFSTSTRTERENPPLSNECKELTSEIQEILLKSKDYNEAKNMVLELYKKIELSKYVYEQNIMRAYLKYNIDLLEYLVTNINRISLVQYLWQYNDPELNQPLTRSNIWVDLPGVRDGLYGVGKGDYYIVTQGRGLFRQCAPGLYFFNSCACCNFPDYEDSSWDYWARCFAAIIAGAGTEGLAGAGVGSSIPGIGTAIGAGVGVVAGGLSGFLLGC